jgi:hypothetical protein
MKRLFLSSALFFLITLAFAQSPEEKAAFLTTQMNTLLSLSSEQVNSVNDTNLLRFEVEASEKYDDIKTMRQQDLQSEAFQSEKAQEIITKLNARVARVESRYDKMLSRTLTASQYALFLQNKNALLAAVVAEFGE